MKKHENRAVVFRIPPPIRIPTLKQIGVQLRHNRKLRHAGKVAADLAIATGIFSFAATAKKMQSHHWVTSHAFFVELFNACRTLTEAKAALASFNLYPPKCPEMIMFVVHQAESEMMTRVS